MENMEHKGYMQMALDLAEKGMHSSMPNPRVGCIVVHNSQVVGQGLHSKTGEDHAEVMAYPKRAIRQKERPPILHWNLAITMERRLLAQIH